MISNILAEICPRTPLKSRVSFMRTSRELRTHLGMESKPQLSPQARAGIDGSEGNVLHGVVNATRAYTFVL